MFGVVVEGVLRWEGHGMPMTPPNPLIIVKMKIGFELREGSE